MEAVHTAEFESPIGVLRVASTAAGLAHLDLPRASGTGFAGWLERFAPGAEVREAWAPNRRAARQLQEFLAGKRRSFDLPLDLRGTAFQHRVYAELLRIPYGETRSYADVAQALSQPGAMRVVGAACGANPLPLVVPCHRVIAAHGRLGGYGGGLALKKRLLAMERADDLL